MNKVLLMGRLTREPDIRYSQGERQMAIARFTLAVNRKVKNDNGQNEADFISCIAFDRQAEFVDKYLHQGTKIAMTGRIQTGSYTKNDGTKVYTTDVVVEEMEFAESKASAESNNSAVNNHQQNHYKPNFHNDNGGNNRNGQQQPCYQQQQMSKDGFMSIPDGVEDDDLPFN